MHPRTLLTFLATTLLVTACAAPAPPEGALPAGIGDVRIPPTNGSAFIYVRPPTPATFSNDSLSIDDVQVESASVLLADNGDDHFTRFTFPQQAPLSVEQEVPSRTWTERSGNTLLVGTVSEWGDSARDHWANGEMVTLHDRFADAWRDLVKAPPAPPKPPIAAGFARNFGPLIERFIARTGVSIPGLPSDLALLRIESVAFVAYADGLERLPNDVEPGVLNDLDLSILAIAHSAYPGLIVGWVLDRFVTTLGLQPVSIAGTPVHYRELAPDVHIFVVRAGSTLFFAIDGNRSDAEELASSVVANIGG